MSDYPRCPRQGCGGVLLFDRGYSGHDDRVYCVCGFSAWRGPQVVMGLPPAAVLSAHGRAVQERERKRVAEKRAQERRALIERERQKLMVKLAKLEKRMSV